jgi:hypothetical protein
MKRAIWDLAGKLGPDRHSAIQQSLHNWTERNESQEKVPDTRKISRVIQELQALDVSVLKTLPEHVWHLREDYEDIKELLQGRPGYHDPTSTGRSRRNQESLQGGGGNNRALQMEQSGHWPGLRRKAATLREQLYAPLPQLLGLCKADPLNPHLILEPQYNGVALRVEEKPLFLALQQHLPDNPAWALLERWKSQVIGIKSLLPDLCQQVMDRLEIKDFPRIPPEESIWRKSGLTESFAKVVVLTSVEDLYADRRVNAFPRRSMEQNYELFSQQQDSNRLVLSWIDLNHRYALAVHEDRGELERIKVLHLKLHEDFRGNREVEQVVAAYQELDELKEALQRELRRIAQLADFPGTCSLESKR